MSDAYSELIKQMVIIMRCGDRFSNDHLAKIFNEKWPELNVKKRNSIIRSIQKLFNAVAYLNKHFPRGLLPQKIPQAIAKNDFKKEMLLMAIEVLNTERCQKESDNNVLALPDLDKYIEVAKKGDR